MRKPGQGCLAVVFVLTMALPALAGEGPNIEAEGVGPSPIEPAEPAARKETPAPQPQAAPEASEEPVIPPADEEPNTKITPAVDAAISAPMSEQDEDILAHPTRSIEDYNRVRDRMLFKRTLPDWAISLMVAPKVFSKADLRQPAQTGFDQTNPSLFGAALGYDRTLLKYSGVLSLGVDAGFYGSAVSNPYGGLLPGFLSATPHVTYEANYFRRQWVVPAVRLGGEFVRYSYSFENQAISGFKELPRADLGALIYLNVFEPSSAATMQDNYGIKRTYVGAFFTIENDATKKDFDLSDRSFRIMLRFEE